MTIPKWAPLTLGYGKSHASVRVVSDVIVTATNAGLCCVCFQTFKPGTRVRIETALLDERRRVAVCTCAACCDAMTSETTEQTA